MTVPAPPILATGWSLHLPGVVPGTALAGLLGSAPGPWADQDAPGAAQAAAVLGRKGLLYKEPSTRLALCAVHRALGLDPGHRPSGPVEPGTAVVACSNLGNVETVAKVTRTIAAEGGRGVSVLDAPNVSSNVIASTVALWFGFGGPNLMICSGATAGLDGLRLAGLLLRSGRAQRVVLVGTEPDDEVATTLHSLGDPAQPLRGGAACVVLRAAYPAEADQPPAGSVLVELVPAGGQWPRPPRLVVGPGGFEPAAHWGDCYGAQGVVDLALAAHLAADDGLGPVGVTGGTGEDATADQPAALVGSRS